MKKSKPKEMPLDCSRCMFVCGDRAELCGAVSPHRVLTTYPVRPAWCPVKLPEKKKTPVR